MTAKLNEFRALNARWLNLHEAAFYCGVCVVYFNKHIRVFVPEDKAARPVMFDRERLDKVMESRQSGNLPSHLKGSTSTALRKEGSRRGMATP